MSRRRSPAALFRFDRPFLKRYGLVAGVDEAGRGPLAGPVVAAAVVLPPHIRLPHLADSKLLSEKQRLSLYVLIQRSALAIGVGQVDHSTIDQINILQATYQAMRQALGSLLLRPGHVLVDGYAIRSPAPASQTGVIDGDAKSACIAAASIVAKVTRDAIMEWWDGCFPHYGFRDHKGYGTLRHRQALQTWGPCPIHRLSYGPVRRILGKSEPIIPA